MHRWVHAEMLSAEVNSSTVFKGCANPEWVSTKGNLVGTTIDLEAAFRQLPLGTSSGPACPICYYCCSSGEPRYICLTALPFGSVSSVAHFLRYSRALWALGCALLWTTWVVYFDDFICLEYQALGCSGVQSLMLMLKILGVPVAKDKLRDPG
eukprot:458595-Amphidinium_carterae.1